MLARLGRGRDFAFESGVEIAGISAVETGIVGTSGTLIFGIGGLSLICIFGDSSTLIVGMEGADAVEGGIEGLAAANGSALVDPSRLKGRSQGDCSCLRTVSLAL